MFIGNDIFTVDEFAFFQDDSPTMNTMHRYSFLQMYFFIGLLCMVLLLTACTKEDQSSPPVILSVVTTGQEHGDGAHAIAGTTSRIQVTTQDDIQLKEIKCTYSNSGDYHSHSLHGGGLIPAFRAPNIGEWTDSRSKNISGTYDQSTLKFSVPEEISGAWILTAAVMDIDGNVSYHEIDVIVENDSIPAILPILTFPASNANGVIELTEGQTFSVFGNIMDENYLSSIAIEIKRNGELFWQEMIEPENEWRYEMEQLVFPTFDSIGEYELVLSVTDRNGWKNWMYATIHVRHQ